jgi:hypothetical protein
MPRIPTIPQENRSIREYDIPPGEVFIDGAPMVLLAGFAMECGADPAAILGFSTHPVNVLVPDPFKVLVAIAHRDSTFWMEGNVAPVQADIGAAYGITRDVDRVWHVDKAKGGADARVEVVSIDLVRNMYEVKVINANIQLG